MFGYRHDGDCGPGKKPINNWAFIFLLPAVFEITAEFLYASTVTRDIAFLITLSSLSFFVYWLTRPKTTYKQVEIFWPQKFFKETVWPFNSLATHLGRIKGDRRLSSILLGTLIALPFLLIFLALFTSADQLFAKSFSSLFSDVKLGEYALKTLRDCIVSVYFLASGFTMFARLHKQATDEVGNHLMPANETSVITFLALLNILFIVFVGYQIAYFFGGQALVTAQGLTYADYARSGFFQLLVVAGLVFVLTWILYRATNMQNRIIGLLTVALGIETGVIIASAISRLLLYIDMYGLTLARWWAMESILIIGFTLLACAIGVLMKINYRKMSKGVFLLVLIAVSLSLTANSEAFIAQYNISRYLSGQTRWLDTMYLLNNLSADAYPALTELANANWPMEGLSWKTDPDKADFTFMSREILNERLDEKRKAIQKQITDNRLSVSLSQLQALAILEQKNNF